MPPKHTCNPQAPKVGAVQIHSYLTNPSLLVCRDADPPPHLADTIPTLASRDTTAPLVFAVSVSRLTLVCLPTMSRAMRHHQGPCGSLLSGMHPHHSRSPAAKTHASTSFSANHKQPPTMSSYRQELNCSMSSPCVQHNQQHHLSLCYRLTLIPTLC